MIFTFCINIDIADIACSVLNVLYSLNILKDLFLYQYSKPPDT